MPQGKAFLNINANTVEVSSLAGFLTTLSTEIKTDKNLSPVLTYAHSELSERFDAFMSATAPAARNQLHHVYDWGNIGVPQHQLWRNTLRGRGNNRYASFEFRASVLPVPVPDGNKRPFKQTHRFIYKAMIMEYNIAVTIRPKRAKMLAFPVSSGQIIFTKGPVVVQNPGGSSTTGAFTAIWSGWWGGPGAAEVFDSSIKRNLEDDLSERAMAKFMRRFRKAKSGSISIADNRSAFAEGSKLAEEFLLERNRKNAARRKRVDV